MSVSEKERVYAELDALRKKSARQKREIRKLRTITSRSEVVALRAEAATYRKALSVIRHRLDAGDLDEGQLKRVLDNALGLRNVQHWQRKMIERLRDEGGEG